VIQNLQGNYVGDGVGDIQIDGLATPPIALTLEAYLV
jgi:hypothetical protein